jgi:hypothetical protein
MRSIHWCALSQRELLTDRPLSRRIGYIAAAAFGTFVCGGLPLFAVAAEADATSCQKLAWPYLNKACSRDAANTSSTRKIRVIATDRNAPATIVAPTANLGEEDTPPRPAIKSVSAPPPAPDATDQQSSPVATKTPDEPPQPPPSKPASVQPPSLSSLGHDRERNSVRTITVSSGAAAAPRNDTIVVRVYHLASGRRITQYSNIPQTAPRRGGQPARVYVVPTEDAAQAFAYAPR